MADDTADLQALLATAAGGDGVVQLEARTYNYTHLDVRIYNGSLTIRGEQGLQWTGPTTSVECRTILHCTAQDDQDAIACFQVQGLIVEDIEFSYAEGYTGTILNFGNNDPGGVGSNAFIVQRCHGISDRNGTYITAKAFLGFSNAVCGVVRDCSFMGAKSLVRGLERPDAFSNDIDILNCRFERCTVGMIVNPSLFNIRGCTFEFTGEGLGAPVAITSDLSSTVAGAEFYQFVRVSNCQFWDASFTGQKCIVQPPGVVWHLRVRDCFFHVFNTTHIQLDGPGSVVMEGNVFAANVPVNAPTLVDLGNPATAKKDVVGIRDNWWNDGSPADNALTVKNYAGHKAARIENNANTGPWDASIAGGGGGLPYDPLLGTFTLTNPPAPFGNSVSATYSGDRVTTSGHNTYHVDQPLSVHGNLYLDGNLAMGQSGDFSEVTYGNQAGTVPCFVSIFGSFTIKMYTPLNPHDGEMWREDNTKDGVKMRINGVTETFAFKGD